MNFLFAGAGAGGERAAIAYTILRCCRLAGVDPVEYLTDVLAAERRFDVTGEFLGSSRGLWDGYASDVVAGADGSALGLVLDRSVPGDETVRLRKYAP